MELQPGWQILEAALQNILDPEFDELSCEEQFRRFDIMDNNLSARRTEIIPADQNDRLVDMLGATMVKVARCWPDKVYEFVINHGGDEAIDRFIALHPDWVHTICPCGCGVKLVAEKHHHEQMKRVGQHRRSGGNGLIIGLISLGHPGRSIH